MTSRVRASILALAFGVFVALPAVAAAQTTEVTIKAGVNRASLSFEGDSDDDVSSLMGLVAGVSVAKNIKNTLGFRVEGLFSQKGAKEEDGSDVFKLKLNYIDVPVLLTVSPTSSGTTSFNFFAGPQVSINTSAKAEFNDDSVDVDDVKGTDLGVVVGVGAKKGKISLDLRYVHGLSGIFDGDDEKTKNKTLTAMIGWQIK